MRFIFLTLFFTLAFFVAVTAQTSQNYTFINATNASLGQTSNGDVISFASASNLFVNNSTAATNTYVPAYDFLFMGKRYNVVVVSLDGVVGLSVDANINTMTQSVNGLNRTTNYPPGANTGPAIAPFWDDLKTAISGRTAVGAVVGTAPYRCVIVEWNANINQNATSASADGTFQLRIYESTGKIEFVYGKMQVGTGSATVTASIGFAAGNSNNTILALKDLSTFATTTITTEEFASRSLVNTSVAGPITALTSSADGSRRIFSFTPPSCNGSFSASSVNRVLATSMQLSWADNISNKLGYLVYRSAVDSNNYQFVTTLAASATSYTATGLNTNTRYYWKVIPYTEGNTQTVLRLTDSTRCSMTGTYSIGSGGDFITLKAAKDSLALWGIVGNTNWELSPSYSFTSETSSVTLKLPPCYQNNSTVTIRPAAGNSINYLHSSVNPIILLDSITNVIIDGRAGGSGTTAMVIAGQGELIKIRNGWSNTLQYLDIRSTSAQANYTALTIEATAGGGAHDNTISNCIIHDSTGNPVPLQLLLSKENGGINTGNIVQNCNFYNFTRFAAVIEGSGWQFLNNSFYATTLITGQDTSGFIQLKYVASSANEHVVTGNYFGGAAPMATGNMLNWKSTALFAGIYAYAKANISNNVFKRLRVETVYKSGVGFYYTSMLQLGLMGSNPPSAVFNVTGNSFGLEQPGDSLHISNGITASYVPLHSAIIRCGQYGTNSITNNSFAHIRTSETNGEHYLNLIEAGYATIQNNNIGTEQSLYQVHHRGGSDLNGIYSNGAAVINNNIITSLTGDYTTAGIYSTASGTQIINNTIKHLKTYYGGVSGDFYSLCGIANMGGGNTVTANTIYNLMDSSVSSNPAVQGIIDRNSASNISRNFIDAFITNENGTGGKSVIGIQLYDVTGKVNNNFIRLGLDTAGNPVKRGGFYGLFSNFGGTIIHNTFYIAGGSITQATGINGATVIYTHPSSHVMNNILINDRTYTGLYGTAMLGQVSGYAYSGFDYNIYHFPIGVKFYGSYTNLQQYQQAANEELHSMQIDPGLAQPQGPTRTLNMHITNGSAAEQRGLDASFYTTITDFDGENRNANTPTDIGADAGLYKKRDLEPPVFYLTPLGQAADTTSRYINVNIVDSLSGVNQTTGKIPVIWYRKSFPVTSPWQMSAGSRISGDSINGTWRFFIDHQAVNVSANGNDSIQYYFVAQDLNAPDNFIGISPSAGASHTSVTQQISPPTQPYAYRIYLPGYIIPPVVNIGAGQRYTSLTNDGGLFEGIKKDSVQGNIIAKISSHLYERGTWSLDSLLTQRNLRLTIVPAHDSLFVISNNGNLSNEMIRFNNADKVTIDGSFNGAGRWLRFVNIHATPASGKATIALLKNTDTFLLKNAELMNNTSNFMNSGIVLIHDGTTKDIEIRNNIFSDVSGNSKPVAGIQGTSTANIYRMVVAGNHFVNMSKAGVHINRYSYNSRLDSNHVYWSDPSPHTSTDFNAFYTGGGVVTTHQIKGNYIGGSQPYAQGAPWVNNSVLSQFIFIKMLTGSDDYSLIENNVIRNFSATNPNGSTFIAIDALGGVQINGNMIGDSTTNNSLQFAGTNFTMIDVGYRKQVVSNNFIGGINITNNTWASPFVAIWSTGDSVVTIRNNIIRNIISASDASGSSSGTFSGIYSFPAAIVEQNDISNITLTGPSAIQFYGVHLLSKKGLISRNRIYNINMPNSANGIIEGVNINGGSWKIWNNQFTLTNGNNANAINIYGVYDKASSAADTKDINFNTFLIGGSQTSGSTSSYGLYVEGNSVTTRFRNNLIENNRSGGTGVHGMVAVKKTSPATYWPGTASNYNLFVGKDSVNAFLWNTSVLSISNWRSNTGGDANSYFTPAAVLPASQLFKDSVNGDLNIDTTNSLCWYVNGKGNPIDSIDTDFNQAGIRSTSAAYGPVDIGSHEFTTGTTPPSLYVYGRHQPNGSDTLTFNGRTVAIINWGNTGILPTLGNAQWYSGIWPNDTTNGGTVNNARFTSSYLHIPVTGGSGYTYSLVYYYDSSMMGKVTNPAYLVLNKRQPNIPGSWQNLPSTVNTGARTVTVNNQTSFSEFTAADVMAPLPLKLLSFIAVAVEKSVQLTWQVAPSDEDHFVVERSTDGQSFSALTNIKANGATVYTATDRNVLQQLSAILYYRLKMVSKTGEVVYSKVAIIKVSNDKFVLSITPNPFSGKIVVQLKLNNAEELVCTLVDLNGKIVYKKNITAVLGLQAIQLEQLDLLPKGSYVLSITGKELHYESLLIKLAQ